MAFELLNHGPVTPHRLHALLRLIARCPGATAEELCALLQPASLMENTQAAENALQVALTLQLVAGDRRGPVRLRVNGEAIEELGAFRETMRQAVLGVTDGAADNYIFNLFSAWYAVLDDAVFRMSGEELATEFNRRVFPTAVTQQMNETKFGTGWRPWAAFLGYGWIFQRGATRLLVPDCQDRIAGLVDAWLADAARPMRFTEFMDQLAVACPELDGGELFQHGWRSGRGGEERGRRLSLMLSTALRGLHDQQRCELIRLGDATEVWSLFPASGHAWQEISHIARGARIADA